MTQDDNISVENTRKKSKRNQGATASTHRKDRLASQLRKNLVRRKTKENRGKEEDVSDTM